MDLHACFLFGFAKSGRAGGIIPEHHRNMGATQISSGWILQVVLTRQINSFRTPKAGAYGDTA